MMRIVSTVVIALTGVAAAAPALNTAQIEKLTGAKGKLDEKEGVFKVSVPRADLKVVANGVHLSPPMGLTTWAAFTKSGEHTMVMGDLCLTEDQVNPVMSAALDNGLDVTALHNHFFWDSPKVMFMHIGGMGDEAKLASAVGVVFAKIKETAAEKPAAPADIDPAKTSLDVAKLASDLGTQGELANGVYKVTIGRTTKMGGHAVGKTMGVNTWAAFAGTDDKAVVDGDFAMLESELQGVLKALRGGGIQVVAIHQHMTTEQPRIMFLHYWGIGPAGNLARTLKAALAKTAQ
jgi:hypothetical protein